MSIRPRRSALYLPASNLKAIAKARTLPCDVVILDLEDAVAPDAKSIARDQAIAAVREGGFGARELVVRVNDLGTAWGRADMDALAGLSPDAVLLPKLNTRNDVEACNTLLEHCPRTQLWIMIETAMSLVRLNDIVAAGGRLACLVLGVNDLAKELGTRPDAQRTQFLSVFTQTIIAARAYQLSILDGVYNALDDEPGLRAQCTQARAFGFDGKTLIHPRQIEPCNDVFTPDAEAIAWAERVVAAFAQPENQKLGAIRLGDVMVERLHLTEAQRTLSLAAAARREQERE